MPLALAPPGAPEVRAAGEFVGAGWFVEFVRLSGVAGFAPLGAPGGEGCWAEPAPRTGEAPEFVPAAVGASVLPAGLLAGFAPAVFDVAWFGPFDEAGPGACFGSPARAAPAAGLPGACSGSSPRGARVPGFGFAAEGLAPEADLPSSPAGVAPGCAFAMRSVGAAEETGEPLPAVGMRWVAASGRASAPAVPAGPALSRAGFFSSFGSDTHTPR
ncbi:hypothetical protein [Nocardia barduliensis]|uniref:hypothetical protein n=1 Tax=Nocardia barduliensis TaxID=2736643 RepID=UPI0015746D1A|nr:hypothetical protein [Nocardia barduliensis]